MEPASFNPSEDAKSKRYSKFHVGELPGSCNSGLSEHEKYTKNELNDSCFFLPLLLIIFINKSSQKISIFPLESGQGPRYMESCDSWCFVAIHSPFAHHKPRPARSPNTYIPDRYRCFHSVHPSIFRPSFEVWSMDHTRDSTPWLEFKTKASYIHGRGYQLG